MTNNDRNRPNGDRRTAPIRTLVVDDSSHWLEPLCYFLESHSGIALVGTASDGVEALASIERLRPELVVLDVQMPRMDGLETVTLIRGRFPETRIVMMSFDDSPAVRKSCEAWGAHAFVPKSAPPASLLDEVFRICDRSHPGAADTVPKI